MNAVPVPGQRISIRIFAMTLIFVCAGTLVQSALYAISLFGYAVLGAARFAVPALTSIAETLPLMAEGACLTGLVTGVYDATYDRVEVRSMLVISVGMAFLPLIVFLLLWVSALIDGSDNPMNLISLLLEWCNPFVVAVRMTGFVVSMMACWIMIDIARDRIPAAGRLLGQ